MLLTTNSQPNSLSDLLHSLQSGLQTLQDIANHECRLCCCELYKVEFRFGSVRLLGSQDRQGAVVERITYIGMRSGEANTVVLLMSAAAKRRKLA